MKRTLVIFCLSIMLTIQVFSQQADLPQSSFEYFGQSLPDEIPEIFAPGIVSTKHRVYANVTFNSDLSEAFWTPNSNDSTFNWNGGMIYTKLEKGMWSTPEEISFLGPEYSHRSPFYDYQDQRLYFQAHMKKDQGWDQKERFYFVDKERNGWSEPALLDTVFNKYSVHWQFSIDKDKNIYFGGSLRGVDKTSGIYCSKFSDGKYLKPEIIFNNDEFDEAVFGPAISPDNDYMIFARIHPRGSTNPRIFSIYVSFLNEENQWSKPFDLGEKLKMDGNQPRISPDGMFIFFVGNDGMSYWVSAEIIEEFKMNMHKE